MRILALLTFVVMGVGAFAQVESEWRGLGRTGGYPDSGLLKEWPEAGPRKLWVANVPNGYSSPAMGKDKIYVTGREEEQEFLLALDYDGKVLWKVAFGKAWDQSFPETRTTPTLANGMVYIISGQGEVSCHDGKTGAQVWYRNAYKEFEGNHNLYGPSESPLIVDNKLIYSPGGSRTTLVALNIDDGKTIWESPSIGDSSAYVSPLYVEHNDIPMIVTVMSNHALGVSPEDGRILWTFDYIGLPTHQNNRYMIITNCNTPMYADGTVFVNKGYDHPSAALTLSEDGTTATLKWSTFDLDTHMGGTILVDGYLYGSNWLNNGMGNWVCVDWETGETRWETKWQNKGSIIYADGMMYLYEEKRGHIALAKPNPEKLDIVSSFRITDGRGPHWGHPVIHQGVLYVRHGDGLIAFAIRK